MDLTTREGTQAALDSLNKMTGFELGRFLGEFAQATLTTAEEIDDINARRAYVAFVVATQRAAIVARYEWDWLYEVIAKGPLAGHGKAEGPEQPGSPPDLLKPLRWAFSKPRTIDQATEVLVRGGVEQNRPEWQDKSTVKARVSGFLCGVREGRFNELEIVETTDGTTVRERSQ